MDGGDGGRRGWWTEGMVDGGGGGRRGWWTEGMVDGGGGGRRGLWTEGMVDGGDGGRRRWWTEEMVNHCCLPNLRRGILQLQLHFEEVVWDRPNENEEVEEDQLLEE